jgi:hypothetical protein
MTSTDDDDLKSMDELLAELDNSLAALMATKSKTVYGTSALKRKRRTQEELQEIDNAIYEIAEDERPITVRGLFYRVMSLGLVPKSEKGYSVVQRQALKMRRSGDLPYGWITDGSRLRVKPSRTPTGKPPWRTQPECIGGTCGLIKVYMLRSGARRMPFAASCHRSRLNTMYH